MKPLIQTPRGRSLLAFTLIELLVVVAIIAILAGLLLPAATAVRNKTTLNRVQGEIGRVKVAIESYQTDKGFYPPDNKPAVPQDSAPKPYPNALYYELTGATIRGDRLSFIASDGSEIVTVVQLQNAFNVSGLNNAGIDGSTEGPVAKDYLPDLNPNQHGLVNLGAGGQRQVLGTIVDGPFLYNVVNGDDINPFRYVSSTPTNNASSFDLWVDVIVGGKTNRISNWSDKPVLLK